MIGEMPINDIDDKEAKSIKCKSLWNGTRDELLRLHDWTWATKRVELQQDATEPVYGFTYAYTLPSDCLRVLMATPNEDDLNDDYQDQAFYRIERGRVLCDEETLYLKYISRVEETGRYDAVFAGCMASRLAFKLAGSLTKSASIAQSMAKIAEIRLSEARGMDNREGGMMTYKRSSWKDAR